MYIGTCEGNPARRGGECCTERGIRHRCLRTEPAPSLELAVAAEAPVIVTHNLKDFAPVRQFGITALAPGTFLQHLAKG
jgi:hypothetical protein